MAGQHVYQGVDNDLLFESTFPHYQGRACKDCDGTKSVDRGARPDTDLQVHYSTIGSGNAVIKDGLKRDQLRKDLGVLCVEMEAAGTIGQILVPGDPGESADSHKKQAVAAIRRGHGGGVGRVR
jgi:hypothetical protein